MLDLASSHYASSVLAYLNTEKIKYVRKNDNPSNCPKVRPIEDFWALLKRKVYENDWTARNTSQLIARIRSSLRALDEQVVQNTELPEKESTL